MLAWLRKELSQSGGSATGSSITWADVVTKLIQSCSHQVLMEAIDYVAERLAFFLKSQKDAVVSWMCTLQNSADEEKTTRLYPRYGQLLNTRDDIRQVVFDTYDQAVDDSCDTFRKIYLQVLLTVYGNPNKFL